MTCAGYWVREGQVLAIARWLVKQPSQYWGTTERNVVKNIHARLRTFCQQWSMLSIDSAEGGIVFQSDGEVDAEKLLRFDLYIDPTLGRYSALSRHRTVTPTPAVPRLRRAIPASWRVVK